MAELPEYNNLPEELSGDNPHQLGQFEDILTEAQKKGIVNHVPEDREQTYQVESQKIRLQTIAERLYLLGYLRRKILPRNIHRATRLVEEAVGKFQKDADLEPDKWVGNVTWYALDQLVSFESEFQEDHWFKNGKIRPQVEQAMHRAIQLRLYCLGLYSSKPKKRFKLLSKVSLSKLGKILRLLVLKNKQFKADFNIETIQVLFDQDLLTRAVAKSSGRYLNSFKTLFSRFENPKDEKLAETFIISCARVELWLLGYKVKIGGRVRGKDDQNQEFSSRIKKDLQKALFSYYQDYESKDENQAKKLAEDITPRLFKNLDAVAQKVEDYDSDDASEQVYESLKPKTEEEKKNFLSKAWGYLKDKGVRLWDGLKRIWRWIKKIGKKIFSFLQKNIFKAFYRFASKAFKIITRGIANVAKSVAVYVKGVLTSDQIIFLFSKDMDTTVYLENNIPKAKVMAGIEKLNQQSKAFALACRIIRFAVKIFKNLALGVFGWAKLLFSLVKSYKKIKLLYKDFKLVASY